jgi:hypothetical protein
MKVGVVPCSVEFVGAGGHLSIFRLAAVDTENVIRRVQYPRFHTGILSVQV